MTTDEIGNVPFWRWTFDEDGKLKTPAADAALTAVDAAALTDLFVFAHGWNNQTNTAENLYQGMFKLMAAAAPKASLGSIGFAGVYWPSIWFPDPPAAKTNEVATATKAGSPGAADAALSGKEIADSLVGSFTDPAQQHAIAEMGKLVDEGLAGVAAGLPDADQQAKLDDFHAHLQSVFGNAADVAAEDGGEASILATSDPKDAYAKISGALGSAPPGGDEQGIGDIFDKVWNGAKDAMRGASYLEMKKRAGTVGAKGLGPLLVALHQHSPAVRVHLMGHSFGARLVSYALSALPSGAGSPVKSVTLIQGAFSHWAFADKNPWGSPGGLHAYRDRVNGPVISTFTPSDWAVGIWYPKASFLSQDDAEDVDTTSPSRWGGMGADGAQSVPGPADAVPLAASGKLYGFQLGQYYRVDASAVIDDTKQSAFAGAHSDIIHPEVAWLPLSAAATAG